MLSFLLNKPPQPLVTTRHQANAKEYTSVQLETSVMRMPITNLSVITFRGPGENFSGILEHIMRKRAFMGRK